MEQHRANPSCNACHGVMDPLGFALENFDAVGGWRDRDLDAGAPIDAGGKLSERQCRSRGPSDLRKALLARPDQFVQTITEKLMTFALGRSLRVHDMPTVRAIVRQAATEGQYVRGDRDGRRRRARRSGCDSSRAAPGTQQALTAVDGRPASRR